MRHTVEIDWIDRDTGHAYVQGFFDDDTPHRLIYCSREGRTWVATDNRTDEEYARGSTLKVVALRLAHRFGHSNPTIHIDREF